MQNTSEQPNLALPKPYVAIMMPSNAYLTKLIYVSQCKYGGIVSNVTKKPEKRMNGTDATGPINTPF